MKAIVTFEGDLEDILREFRLPERDITDCARFFIAGNKELSGHLRSTGIKMTVRPVSENYCQPNG